MLRSSDRNLNQTESDPSKDYDDPTRNEKRGRKLPLLRKDDNMFCTQCGSKLNEGTRFCIQCGASVTAAVRPVSKPEPEPSPQPDESARARNNILPAGMTRDANGTFRWMVTNGKKPVEYYMNEEKAAKLLEVREIKPDSKAKKAALGILDFVDAFGGGDSPYAELPSEMLGGPDETMYTPSERPWSYRYMIWIKGDRSHNRIRLYAEGSPEWLYVSTQEQYDFVYAYITSHCPNSKIK